MSDLERIRKKTKKLLDRRNIPILPSLPLLDGIQIKPPTKVLERIVSLYCLAGLANGADSGLLLEWLVEEGALNFLDINDQNILHGGEFSESLLNEFSWKQESVYVLAWAGKILGKIAWPNCECNLVKVFPKIPPEISIESFRTSFILRNQNQIIEALDLYYNLHASVLHPELWSLNVSKYKPRIEVVAERRLALEWLCSEQTDWTEIVLDT